MVIINLMRVPIGSVGTVGRQVLEQIVLNAQRIIDISNGKAIQFGDNGVDDRFGGRFREQIGDRIDIIRQK